MSNAKTTRSMIAMIGDALKLHCKFAEDLADYLVSTGGWAEDCVDVHMLIEGSVCSNLEKCGLSHDSDNLGARAMRNTLEGMLFAYAMGAYEKRMADLGIEIDRGRA